MHEKQLFVAEYASGPVCAEVPWGRSALQKSLDFVIVKAKLAEDAENVRPRKLMRSHVNGDDPLLSFQDAHIEAVIAPAFIDVKSTAPCKHVIPSEARNFVVLPGETKIPRF
jgi:hypothetical protein